MQQLIARWKVYWATGDDLVRAGQAAQILRQFALIGLALLLPRLVADRVEVGIWEQFQYLGYLLGFAWLTGIGQAYLRDVRQLPTEQAALLTRQLGVLTFGISAGLCLFCFLARRPVLQFLTGDPELAGWPIYLLFLLTHWPGLMYEQVLLAARRARRLLWFSAASNGGLLLVLVIPLWMGSSWSEALPGLIVLSGVKLLFLLDPRGWGFHPVLTSEVANDAADTKPIPKTRLSGYLPLVAYAGLGALVVSFDPWLVNFWYGGDESVFAVYRYGTREIPLIVAATNGIGAAVLPLVGQDRTLALARIKSSSLRLMHLFFPLAIGLMLTSGWWWTWLFTDRFADSLPLFRVFLLVSSSRFLMAIILLTGTGHGRALVGLGLAELGLNSLFSLLFVAWLGLIGIVWATVLVYTLDRVLAIAYLRYREGIRLRAYCHLGWLAAYTLALFAAYLLA